MRILASFALGVLISCGPRGAQEPTDGRLAGEPVVTLLRPLVEDLATGDPVRIAIHWERSSGPIEEDDETSKIELLRLESLQSFRFQVVRPDGTALELHARVADVVGGGGLRNPIYVAPTYFLTLGPDLLDDGTGLSGPWVGQRPDFGQAGSYHLTITGELRFAQHPSVRFRSPAVEVRIREHGSAPLGEIVDSARRVLAASGEGPTLGPAEHPFVGLVQGVVVQDAQDNRVVRFATLGPEHKGEPRYVLHSFVFDPHGNLLGHERWEAGECVAAGTPVETEAGPAAVESLRPGDSLWGFDVVANQPVLVTVRSMRAFVARQTVRVGALRATALHPVWIAGTWQPVGKLSRQAIVEPVVVYDLDVSSPHTYFAGGVLLHNKSIFYTPGFHDPWHFMWSD